MDKIILLLDTTLHHKDATGITLSNLFGVFQKGNLFMIGTADKTKHSLEEGYHNTFDLGENEIKHRFPLSFIKLLYSKFNKHYSNLNNGMNDRNIVQNSVKKSINNKMHKSVKDYFIKKVTACFKLFGLDLFFFRYCLSVELKRWIEEASPDYLYAVLSTRHSIRFASDVVKEFNIPLIIHIMDDWPTVIGNNTLFPNYWNKIVNNEFKQLVDISYRRLAISEKMAIEYNTRFGGEWNFFHNPVSLLNWEKFQINQISLSKNKYRIGYFGRIGKANEQSIRLFIDVVKSGKLSSPVEFHLYTNNINNNENVENVIFHPFIDNNLMPSTITSFDFLLLPISFLDSDVLFAKYSIPTKLSEYLISGVPVIILAPRGIALSEFVIKNNCSLSINTDNINEIIQELNDFIIDPKIQNIYSKNGKSVALKEFEIAIVGERFRKIFEN